MKKATDNQSMTLLAYAFISMQLSLKVDMHMSISRCDNAGDLSDSASLQFGGSKQTLRPHGELCSPLPVLGRLFIYSRKSE